jgi:hypothetical protein
MFRNVTSAMAPRGKGGARCGGRLHWPWNRGRKNGRGSMCDLSMRAAFCPPPKAFYEAKASHPNANSRLTIFFFR